MTEHKKYGNNKAQEKFKAEQKIRDEKAERIELEKSIETSVKTFADLRKLLNKPKLGSLSDLI